MIQANLEFYTENFLLIYLKIAVGLVNVYSGQAETFYFFLLNCKDGKSNISRTV
jgi:hypothetical protein